MDARTLTELLTAPLAVPIDGGGEGVLAELSSCVADCGDPAAHVAVADGVPGVAIIYNVPVDRERAAEPTRKVWQGRHRGDIDAAVAEWVAMIVRANTFRGIAVAHGVVDGEAVGLPGWVSVQFFFPPDQLAEAPRFTATARAMLGALTRATLTW